MGRELIRPFLNFWLSTTPIVIEGPVDARTCMRRIIHDAQRVRPLVRSDRKEEGGVATLLANPVEMIERGAPHVIRSEKQLADYTRELYRLTAEPRPTTAQKRYTVPQASAFSSTSTA